MLHFLGSICASDLAAKIGSHFLDLSFQFMGFQIREPGSFLLTGHKSLNIDNFRTAKLITDIDLMGL